MEEWLASIALAAAIPFVGYGLLLALTGWLERRRLSRPGPRPSPPGAVFPRVVGLTSSTIVALLVGATLPGPTLHYLGFVVGFGAMIAAWSMHGIPGHSRGFKYALFLGGGALFGTTFGSDRALAEILGLELTMLFIAPSVVVIVATTLWIVSVLEPDVPPRGPYEYGMVHRWYWRVMSIQGPDPGSFLRYLPLMVSQLGPGFLLIRYAVRAKVLEHPFLYLRVQASADAAQVFSEVIGPALYRRGPFVGLVNAQRGTADGLPQLWAADFSTVPTQDWQAWVVSTVARSRAVVLDVTGVPPGELPWEIEQVTAMVPSERLLVVSQTATSPLGPEYAHVHVELGAPDPARAAVAAFAGHVNGSFGVVDPRRGRFTRRRRRATGWMIVGVATVWLATLNATSIRDYADPPPPPVDRHRELTRFELVQVLRFARLRRVRRSPQACQRFAEEQGPPDSWDTPIEISCRYGRLEVRSAGADREFFTDDDLVLPRRRR